MFLIRLKQTFTVAEQLMFSFFVVVVVAFLYILDSSDRLCLLLWLRWEIRSCWGGGQDDSALLTGQRAASWGFSHLGHIYSHTDSNFTVASFDKL